MGEFDIKSLIILLRYSRDSLYNSNADKGDYNYNIPIGLAYISAFLKQHNHEVQFLNLNHCDGIVSELIKNRFLKKSYDFVITGGISPFYPDVKDCVDTVRKCSPSTRIILGGGLVSSQPKIIFDLLQPDYGVIGEGELTIKELFECLENNGDINKVNGLIFRNTNGQLIFTKPRDPIIDLDLLPWPDYQGLGFDVYLDHISTSDLHFFSIFDNPRAYPIIASRSCPFSCTFCFHPLGKKYRKRSIENVMNELEYAIKKYKINLILFYDELFATDIKRIHDFCGRLTELLKTIPWDVKWICQMRVDVLDEEMIITLKNAGCFCLSLGLESYSATVLKSMNKMITPKQIDDAIRLCAHKNMGFTGNFIFGDTAETTETYHETITYWKENTHIIKNQIILGYITIYQGSPLYERAVKKGIVKDEVAFIEERTSKNEIENFTENMTDGEFKTMIREISKANLITPVYSVPSVNTKINGISEIHVKCPHCNSISIYKNIIIPPLLGFQSSDRKLVTLICRNCNARIRVISKHENFTIMIYKILGFKIGTIIITYVLSPPLMLLRIINKYVQKML